jgi:hypothetical protein
MIFEYLSILAAARIKDGFVVASVGLNSLIAENKMTVKF